MAVCGTGLDVIYPKEHLDLARNIRKQGLLVSELPLGTPPKACHFPRRNRIIAALSIGVVVIEAAEKSGSLITARLASELGREVFAVPGSICHPLSSGCHLLIQQGAKLVRNPEEVLEELVF
jgi:DNA processing protein